MSGIEEYVNDINVVRSCSWVETAFALVKKHHFGLDISQAFLLREDYTESMKEVVEAEIEKRHKELHEAVSETLAAFRRRHFKIIENP